MPVAVEFPPHSAEWTFFIAAVVLLAGPLIAERFRMPGLVGVIIGGTLVGPFVLDWVAREGTVEALWALGILYLMFIAGLELALDDFALCRGRVYGSILVDGETHHVVDLLPHRTAETVRTWLQCHPGVEIVTRDRSTEYARGVSEGAPDVIQVADRWHVLHNLREAVMRRGIRADEAAQGSGLGLAIVRDLAEIHGGSILLEESPMGGARARPSLAA